LCVIYNFSYRMGVLRTRHRAPSEHEPSPGVARLERGSCRAFPSSQTPPHVVLRSDPSLEQLALEWVSHNKSRVYKLETPQTAPTTNTCATHASDPFIQFAPRNEHVLASLRQVFASRRDLSPSDNTPQNSGTPRDNAVLTHTVAMEVLERKLMTHVCDALCRKNPPYKAGVQSGCSRNTPPPSAASSDKIATGFQTCAYIVDRNSSRDPRFGQKQLCLPITTPSPEQIEKCTLDASYRENVLLNIARVIGSVCKRSDMVEVSLHQESPDHADDIVRSVLDKSTTHNTVYIDRNVVPLALGDIKSCEDLLFGECRITSSPDFCLTEATATTYAGAVQAYQRYNNIRICPQITLIPMKPLKLTNAEDSRWSSSYSGFFGKGTPMIVSMRCPQLCVSHLEVAVTGVANHVKFGPNHTTRIVEMMNHLAPFVNRCSELCMKLPSETVTEVNEDHSCPTPSTVEIKHCFSHNAARGMSAYVGTHVFSLPVGILNTYVLPTQPSSTHRNSCATLFPTEQQLVVHMAVLFGGMPTT
jgi:hypothetical protein